MDRDYIKSKLANLPLEPGCYLMKNNKGQIIYVGKAKKLKNRVNQYFVGAHDFKTTKMVSNIEDFDFIVTSSEKEALVLEINLIKKHRPRFNVMFIDDSSYPYIKLTKEKYPILSVARDIRKSKNARYFGPFPDATAAHETAKLLINLYPLRRCKNMGNKVCLYYHMHQCLGPCEFEIDPSVYKKMEEDIINFLNGDTSKVIKMLKEKMQHASDNMEYELAQQYQNQLVAIDHIVDKQKIEVNDKKSRDVFAYYSDKGYIAFQGFFVRNGVVIEKEFKLTPLYGDEHEEFLSFVAQYYQNHPLPKEIVLPNDTDITGLEAFTDNRIIQPQKGYKVRLIEMCKANAKQQLELKFDSVNQREELTEEAVKQFSEIVNKDVHRVELYDNSHIAGAFTVAACVVYEDGQPSKKDYRLYKLHTTNSDTDSMKEVLYRRYFKIVSEQGLLPDCILVDGGLNQIHAAKEILDGLDVKVLIYGLVKDDHHNTANLMDVDGNLLEVKKDSNLFFLLTRMQDEVHRVAITYHRKLRNKAQTKSILDEVEGLGPKRKRQLIKHFTNFKNIKEASIEQFKEVLPEKVAIELYETLHEVE